jgi:predicted NBD/HSP70 family sugar kinase
MTATIGSTPFELVDESAIHTATYEGAERRRTRPLVAVCERLAKARRATLAVTVLRIMLVVALWTALAAPHLMDSSLLVIRTGVPLVYVVAELFGLAVVLHHQAQLARAATLY